MRVYLAGIMQGSLATNEVTDQDYRAQLADLLRAYVPQVEVFDPWQAYPGSLAYDDGQVRTTLQALVEQAVGSDLVVAYLPQASLGTAVEVWEAWRAGVPVIAISPMSANWVVRTCAGHRFDTMEEFAQAVREGQLPVLLAGSA